MADAPRRLALLGSRDLAQQIARHAAAWGGMHVAGFFDDFRPRGEATPSGPILGRLEDAAAERRKGTFDVLLVAIGYRHLDARAEAFLRCADAIEFATLVHPSVVVSAGVALGRGVVVLGGGVLDLDASIADDVFIHPACSISHDTTVGAHSFLGPRVTLAGNVRVGSRCFLGVGTTVIDGVTIGDGVRTGGGAVVTGDLTEPGTYAGVPARRLA